MTKKYWRYIIVLFCLSNLFGFDDKTSFSFVEIPEAYQTRIYDVLQDTTGFIWFVTSEKGLYKYDGVTFKNFPQLSNPRNVIVNRKNDIIVNADEGLYRYNEALNAFENIFFTGPTTRYNKILNLKFIDDNKICYRIADSVHVLNIVTKEKKLIDANTQPRDYLKINDNKLLAASHSRGLIEYRFGKETKRDILVDLRIHALLRDNVDKNIVWFSYMGGIGKIDLTTNNFETFDLFPKTVSLDLEFLNDREILVGSSDGLYIFDKFTKKFYNEGFNKRWKTNTLKILKDKEGSFWFATVKGLIKSEPVRAIKHFTFQDEIKRADNTVLTMCSNDSGGLWTVYGNNKFSLINSFNNNSISFDIDEDMTDESIRLIEDDNNGNLFVNFRNDVKIYSIDEKSKTLSFKKDLDIFHPMYIVKDDFRNIWISNFNYLYRINGTEVVEKFDFKNITTIHSLNDSVLWLGIHSKQYPSLLKFNYNTGSVIDSLSLEKYRQEIGGLSIKNIYYDGKFDVIYVATSTAGIIEINLKPGEINIYNVKGGLPSNNILGLMKDEIGRFWFNTADGLVVIEDNNILSFGVKNGFECYNIQKKHHLGRYSFYTNKMLYKSPNGAIYIGGRNGVCSFDPNVLLQKSEKSPLLLTSVQLFGEPAYIKEVANGTRNFKFSHQQNIITFHFAAMTYKRLNTNRYSFMLENFNKQWENSIDNSVTFKNLDPGKYTLKTRYSDYTGQWWDGPDYKITIAPPFWETYSFWIAVIVLLSATVFGVIKYQTYRIQNLNTVLEYRVMQKTQDLHEKQGELEKINQKLEELVDLRTKKLTHTNKKLIDEIEKKELLNVELQKSRDIISFNLLQQTVLSQILIEFVSLENFENKISKILELIGSEFNFSSVFLFEDEHQEKESSEIIQWVENESIKKFPVLKYSEFQNRLAALHSNEIIFVENVYDLEPTMQEELNHYGIISLLILPLIVNEKFYGFLGFDSRHTNFHWTDSLINLLKTITNILSNAFERKQFQMDLLESEKTARALLNASDNFAVLFDTKEKIKLANRNFLEVIGKTMAEIIDTKITDYYPANSITLRFENYYKCLNTNKVIKFEDEVKNKVFSNVISPIQDAKGEISRIAFFSTDITKLKQAEKILKAHQEELRKEVEQRTRELRFINNELLREITNREKAEKELKVSEKIKRENLKKLALQLAHEIKNPLSSINSSAQLVETIQRMQPDVDKTIKHMQRITKNVDTCKRVINELYEFTHDASLESQPVKTETLFTELTEYADNIENDKKIHLACENNAENYYISMDKFRVLQALKNIVTNSLDAIDKEGRIEIKFFAENQKLKISISDNGSGIPEEALAKVFEPFYTSKSKGFGLGLAIVKKIVERHKGTISIDSEPGVGTKTTIIFPGLEKYIGALDG